MAIESLPRGATLRVCTLTPLELLELAEILLPSFLTGNVLYCFWKEQVQCPTTLTLLLLHSHTTSFYACCGFNVFFAVFICR
jgi:hypothetical protein